MISIEFSGDAGRLFDAEFVQHASKAVFHYFKYELRRQTVSVGEFAQALEKVLRGFALTARALCPQPVTHPALNHPTPSADLRLLLGDPGRDFELFFFPRLRDHLRRQLKQGQTVLRFKGLRGCVKKLIGARRRGLRCRQLEAQIVNFLRACLSAEPRQAEMALVVE